MHCDKKRKKRSIKDDKIFSKKGVIKIESKWILCPICGNKTRDRIRKDTILKNYLLPKMQARNID